MKKSRRRSRRDYYEEIDSWDDEDIEDEDRAEDDEDADADSPDEETVYSTDMDDPEETDDSDEPAEDDDPEDDESDDADERYSDGRYSEDDENTEDGEDSGDDEDAEDGEDYGDDEEPEDSDEEEYEDEETYLRRMRHRRRIRNQIIVYIVVAVLLAALAFGIYSGISWIWGKISSFKKQQTLEQQIEETMEAEEEEEIVIEAPEPDAEDAAAEEEPEEDVDYLGDAVDSFIADLTVEEKVAQLFVITPGALTGTSSPTQAGETTANALSQYAVGGLVYDSDNIVDDEQLKDLLDNTWSMSKFDLFLAVEEPGGDDCSVYGSSLTDIPQVDDPATIAEGGDSSLALNAGTTIASYLSGFGFNIDIAPDCSVASSDDMIGRDLAYGSDAATAYDMITQMVTGLESGGVDACLPNFPGNGNITEDTAKARVESEATADDLAAQTVAYDCGIKAGAKIVMLNNVTYTVADESASPASLSEYVIGTLLRGNMGYDGIVMTGPLNEKAITDYYTADEAALYAIAAGADLIYMPEDFETAYEGLLAAVKDGTIPESRLDESLKRIYRVKLADDVEQN